jgi:hypothetical protein
MLPQTAAAGYVLWVAATSDGEVYTCNTQDDGYAGTLENKRKPNDAMELAREGEPYLPGQVGGGRAAGGGGGSCRCLAGGVQEGRQGRGPGRRAAGLSKAAAASRQRPPPSVACVEQAALS